MSDSTHSLGLIEQLKLVNLLDAIAARLNPILFPPHSLEPLRSLSAKLPAISPLLFELRMLNQDPTLDISLPLSEDVCFHSSNGAASPWERIVALRRATQAGGEFAGAIATNVFWCEFDCNQMGNFIPVPGVFLDISQELTKSKNESFLCQLICRAVSILTGEMVAYSTQQTLEATLKALPKGVYLTQFGVMLSRISNNRTTASSLRVNFSGWEGINIANWLETVGCKAAAAEVAGVTQEIPTLLSRIIVTLDVGREISPRVGIECHPTLIEDVCSGEKSNHIWLQEFTSWLVARYKASNKKIEALCSWNGYKELPICDGGESKSGYYACATDISHLKLVFDPQTGLQAKAYLLADFMHQDDDKSDKAPIFL